MRSVSKTNKETNIDKKLDEESGKENSLFGSEDDKRRWVEESLLKEFNDMTT